MWGAEARPVLARGAEARPPHPPQRTPSAQLAGRRGCVQDLTSRDTAAAASRTFSAASGPPCSIASVTQ
jgi:hypothetical protein